MENKNINYSKPTKKWKMGVLEVTKWSNAGKNPEDNDWFNYLLKISWRDKADTRVWHHNDIRFNQKQLTELKVLFDSVLLEETLTEISRYR